MAGLPLKCKARLNTVLAGICPRFGLSRGCEPQSLGQGQMLSAGFRLAILKRLVSKHRERFP